MKVILDREEVHRILLEHFNAKYGTTFNTVNDFEYRYRSELVLETKPEDDDE